ncbi:hypothetical protein, partial [Micrococcus flavus]|uniref:hypothetical protein n=1 Tax=Micrococcus flavus TaxID=384602 RepID=UPI001E48E0DA
GPGRPHHPDIQNQRNPANYLTRDSRRVKWTDWQIGGVDWIHRWCTDQQDEQLADATVYTEGQSPEQVATEIVTRLQHHEAQTHAPG